MDRSENILLRYTKQILIALTFVSVAVFIRIVFFKSLGRGIPYLTFYPTVALVALFGTFFSGIIVTMLSFLLTFFWIQNGHLSTAEIMAEVVFVISSLVISTVGASKVRTQNKLILATRELEKNNEILQEQIKARQKADIDLKLSNTELSTKLQELEKMNTIMADRELKMIELKKEIEVLKANS